MISVIVPFHNEKENLPALLERLNKVLGALKEKSEIILVDDGSTDEYAVDAKVVVHRKQLGKGRALETGLA
ncbi:MAG: glycosyltransferase, partial [Microgenomates group bacterium]